MPADRTSTAPFRGLSPQLKGDLFTDVVHRRLLSTDASIFQVVPAAVVYPRCTADVQQTVRFARAHGLSIHSRGAGSGVGGAALGTGIVVDFTRYMNRLLALDLDDKTFECEPGYRMGELETVLSGSGLFFPPDPSSGEFAAFGGMAGTNASGAHSVKYGNVADYLLDAEMVLGDGTRITLSEVAAVPIRKLPPHLRSLAEIYLDHQDRIESGYPDTPFNSAGYNLRKLVHGGRLDLRGLVVGSEGTLGVFTRLKFRLAEKPAYDSLVVAYMDDIVASAEAVRELLPLGPSGIEVMDKSLIELARETDAGLRDKLPGNVDNVLMIEFDGFDPESCASPAAEALRLLKDGGFTQRAYLAVSVSEKQRFWTIRKAAVPILNRLKGTKKILALIEDAAVPIRSLVVFFEGIYRILNRHGVRFVVVGHISKGLMHVRPLLDLKDPDDVGKLRSIADDFYEMVQNLDGTVSGEHGDGRLRSAYVKRRYPEIYPLFLKTKSLLDPENLLNPDIITHHDPDQMARDLRYGSAYRRICNPTLYLSWPEGFEAEAEKCHGCSKCTTLTHATRMCPVYKVTREEAATPKAKANALRDLISGRFESEDAFEAVFQDVMARCVYCGSCFRECPSNVNIPKLAMEARARDAKRFGNSMADRILTRLEETARVARRLSPLTGPILSLVSARYLMERATGISARRRPVETAARSLRDRVEERSGTGNRKVLFFSGCYGNYVEPSIGLAAVRVLTHLGLEVLTPGQHCCGLPMLSKGMIAGARKKVRKNLLSWGQQLTSVDAVIVTCSSCGLALSEEWKALSDHPLLETLRRKLVHISAFVHRNKDRLRLKPGAAALAYHTPCHLRIQADPDSSIRLLGLLEGATVKPLDTHCCGMAGSWGMMADHFELSRRIGNDLIRKLHDAGVETGVTDCPTCRLQMTQFSTLPIRHPIEIIADHLVNC